MSIEKILGYILIILCIIGVLFGLVGMMVTLISFDNSQSDYNYWKYGYYVSDKELSCLNKCNGDYYYHENIILWFLPNKCECREDRK